MKSCFHCRFWDPRDSLPGVGVCSMLPQVIDIEDGDGEPVVDWLDPINDGTDIFTKSNFGCHAWKEQV